MAGSLNKVDLIGRLGQDPKLTYLPSGKAVCEFSVATSETWKDKEGERQESTEWHTVKVYGRPAEFFSNHLSKGRLVYITGTLRTRKWEKEGHTFYKTEILLFGPTHGIKFLDSMKTDETAGRSSAPGEDDHGPAFPSEASGMDDVPF